MTDFIRISEAAKRLGITRARMYQMIEEKKLPTVKILGTTAIDAALLETTAIKDRRTTKNSKIKAKV